MNDRLMCPECGKRMTLDFATSALTCKHCGYKRGTGLEERAAEIRARGARPHISLTHVGEVAPRARTLFESGHDYLHADNRAEALRAFQSALDIQHDFADAHLWIAKISEGQPAVQREHLSAVLAHNPGHVEATRMILILNGRLTPEQAAQTHHHNDPEVRRAEGAVKASVTVLRCPTCGGDLTVNDDSGRVECAFCGYSGDTLSARAKADTGGDSFLAAMLERKAKAVRWVIGERLLHCNDCAAERTIAAGKMSSRCPFCASNQVIEQDALNSFEQPEGLIPFKISRQQAGSAIREKLQSGLERFKGLFVNNRVASATLTGFYLPFWVFDAAIKVTRTRVEKRVNDDHIRRGIQPSITETLHDALYDIKIPAVTSPPAALITQLGDYSMGDLVVYQPRLLAKYPAELYSIDFDKAALEARSVAAQTMRQRYGQNELDDSIKITNLFSAMQQMSFRLILMPVWIASLVEEDGDIRAALVNGQTGRVALGKAEKPRP